MKFLNNKIVIGSIVLMIIIGFVFNPIKYLFNYSKCSNFPIYISDPFILPTPGTVGVNAPDLGRVTTIKNGKEIKIADVIRYYQSNDLNLGLTEFENDDMKENFEKMKSCIDTKGKYKISG